MVTTLAILVFLFAVLKLTIKRGSHEYISYGPRLISVVLLIVLIVAINI